MKSTGIIRRIDDLGRIVIPKETRTALRIKEGDNVEIYVEDEKIILRKHSILNKMNELAIDFTNAIYDYLKKNVLIIDKDHIIAASGPLKKELINKPISKMLEQAILRRDNRIENHEKLLKITEDFEVETTYVICPILVNSEVEGMMLIFSKEDKVGIVDEKITKIACHFLTNYLE